MFGRRMPPSGSVWSGECSPVDVSVFAVDFEAETICLDGLRLGLFRVEVRWPVNLFC